MGADRIYRALNAAIGNRYRRAAANSSSSSSRSRATTLRRSHVASLNLPSTPVYIGISLTRYSSLLAHPVYILCARICVCRSETRAELIVRAYTTNDSLPYVFPRAFTRSCYTYIRNSLPVNPLHKRKWIFAKIVWMLFSFTPLFEYFRRVVIPPKARFPNEFKRTKFVPF